MRNTIRGEWGERSEGLIACIAGVHIRGEQKAAAGEGEGLKNGEGGGDGKGEMYVHPAFRLRPNFRTTIKRVGHGWVCTYHFETRTMNVLISSWDKHYAPDEISCLF